MNPNQPPAPPSFSTPEELERLLAEALESEEQGTVMTPEAWERLWEECGLTRPSQKLAS